MLKHLIIMKFKDGAPEEDISRMAEMLGRLPAAISEIKGFRFGRDIVRSERSYDFALVSDFEDLEALRRYQLHPDHVAVLSLARRVSSAILAVDFEY